MTVWTMAQLTQVRGLRAALTLDPLVIDQGAPEVLREAQSKIADWLCDAAHAYAVEIAPADIRFKTSDSMHGVKVIGRWEPDVAEVVLTGAFEDDGLHVDFRDAPWGDLFVSRPTELALTDPLAAMEFGPAPTQSLGLWCSGWHETGRYWIYTEA